jgi:hypothetical protein
MININLIPKEQKETLKKVRFYFYLKEAIVLFFLFISIISIILLASYYYLEKQLVETKITNILNTTSGEDLNHKIISVNKKIKEAENIQKNFSYNHKIVEKFLTLNFNNISLNQIKIYNQQNIIEFSGISKTRSDLLKLKVNLEEQTWINRVDLPIANLIDKENNIFNIKIEINRDQL